MHVNTAGETLANAIRIGVKEACPVCDRVVPIEEVQGEARFIDVGDAIDIGIVTSLVYNSGILFSKERVEMIRTFSTARYLYRVSEANAKRSYHPGGRR